MIEVHFIGKSGKIHKDKAGDRDFLYETFDGIHPLTSDSVFRDIKKGSDRAIIVIWDFVTPPYGAQTSKDYIEGILRVIRMAHKTDKEMRYSPMWIRGFRAALTKYLGPIIVLIFVIYALFSGAGAGYHV